MDDVTSRPPAPRGPNLPHPTRAYVENLKIHEPKDCTVEYIERNAQLMIGRIDIADPAVVVRLIPTSDDTHVHLLVVRETEQGGKKVKVVCGNQYPMRVIVESWWVPESRIGDLDQLPDDPTPSPPPDPGPEPAPDPPQSERMLFWFTYGHLPDHLQEVSAAFAAIADHVVHVIEPGPERTVSLRKLLEAKDAAVRACVRPGG